MSGYQQPPPDYIAGIHQQADAEATRRAQEYQEAQQKAAEAAAEANRIAEERRRAMEQGTADAANRGFWTSQGR
jgi:flagellar biosynthesis/type III secretory pathway protein FliH